ncbi:hypothetical protein JOC36_000931 [Weissella uvarum]|uniref:hypothetical protein n=1 Tax=Weissella uvarum TaxID=1479233 RepID=UPI001962036C|nr:hypothetical protein [Weissella uvarum]MBM7617374.1 hypothetical protein [Weissella uvarum]MCM0595739.1 hypothetical protein [Weissella uvarum]
MANSLKSDYSEKTELAYLKPYSKSNVSGQVFRNPNSSNENIFIVKLTYPVLKTGSTAKEIATGKHDNSKVTFQKQTTFDLVNLDSKHVQSISDSNPDTGKLLYEIDNYKIDRQDN